MSQPDHSLDPELFSSAWAAEVCRRLGASEAYRDAAAAWEGAIAFELAGADGEGPGRAVLLDLWHGECRGAREASAEDLAGVPFLIRGAARSWKAVLVDGADPLFAIMAGKLRLTRGSLSALIPFARAAQELVAAARGVAASPPSARAGSGEAVPETL